jgi:hypothetical protein
MILEYCKYLAILTREATFRLTGEGASSPAANAT